MKNLFIIAVLCIIVFLVGYIVIVHEELSEDIQSAAGSAMVIAFITFCITIVKMITVKRLLIITTACIILILVGYALIPDQVKEDLPAWVESLVSVAFAIPVMAIYITLSLIGTTIGMTGKLIRAAENLLFPDNANSRQCDRW
ncbi:hypothetical protein JW979_05225 [bacterium]|nr:hypothetical protein [candidate division CSSED10-310 bacterium]